MGRKRGELSLDNEVKDTVGQLEKREKWGVGIEEIWKPSLVQKQSLTCSY